MPNDSVSRPAELYFQYIYGNIGDSRQINCGLSGIHLPKKTSLHCMKPKRKKKKEKNIE